MGSCKMCVYENDKAMCPENCLVRIKIEEDKQNYEDAMDNWYESFGRYYRGKR